MLHAVCLAMRREAPSRLIKRLQSRSVVAQAQLDAFSDDELGIGRSLRKPVIALGTWAQTHLAEIDAARSAFDRRDDRA